MSELLTMQDLANGHLDVKALGEAANGDENTIVTTRTGETYPSAKKAIKTMFETGSFPAKPFLKLVDAYSNVPVNTYAVITNDTTGNNGYYRNIAGVLSKITYQPVTETRLLASANDTLTSSKSYTDSKVSEFSASQAVEKSKSNIKSLLNNPLRSAKIKLIGDSITWGLGDSTTSTTSPRYGDLRDARSTTAYTSKTWANLLRQWIANVYGNGLIIDDVAGSAYSEREIIVSFNEIAKSVTGTNQNGAVIANLELIQANTAPAGSTLKLISSINSFIFNPREIEFEVNGDNLNILYESNDTSGVSDSKFEIYVDDVLLETVDYYSAEKSYKEKPITFAYGNHKIKIKNISSAVNGFVTLTGFKFKRKIWVVNEGIIGSSISSWLSKSLFEETLTGTDDIVIIMLGTNDRASGYKIGNYYRQYQQALDKIKLLSPKSELVLMSSTYADNEDPLVYHYNMRDVNRITESLARANNLAFISQLKATTKAKMEGVSILSDGLHLNDAGNKLYFDAIVDKLFI